MDRRHTIAEGVLACKSLTARYFPGFDDSNRTKQAPGLPNHLAWCLGHCALTMQRIAEKIDGTPISEHDFFLGGKKGDAARFGTETVSFGSGPVDDRALYPTLARCVDIYNAGCERLADAVLASADEKLDETIRWGAGQVSLQSAALRMVFHNGTHLGQIADLRRALGFRPVMT
ncbi:MAG: DinB family protein [Phycisphaerales bacterium]|nr:DinB family protein [Phycisphaerales bacterium]